MEGDESEDSQVSWGFPPLSQMPPPRRPQWVVPISPPAWGCELQAVSHGKEDIVLRWSDMEGGGPHVMWRHIPSSPALRSSSSISHSFACLLVHPSTLSFGCSPTYALCPSVPPSLSSPVRMFIYLLCLTCLLQLPYIFGDIFSLGKLDYLGFLCKGFVEGAVLPGGTCRW